MTYAAEISQPATRDLVVEARRYLLRGRGRYLADGRCASWGFRRVQVSERNCRLRVAFYRDDGPWSARQSVIEFTAIS